MSVKLGLLALLAEEPKYGARLRAEFEARTGGTWPLNVGQVYTTLSRLERDGLVEAVGEDAEGRIAYRLTSTGRSEVSRWWLEPVDRDSTPRDELVIKLALAVTVEGVDVHRVVQTQRTATLKHLQDLTRLKHRASAGGRDTETDTDSHDTAWLLVLENLVFAAEAEVRWLDHVETRLAREASRPRRRTSGTPTDEPTNEHGRGHEQGQPTTSEKDHHRTTA
jgi:DNA-binding PadR family transcriptional regulator